MDKDAAFMKAINEIIVLIAEITNPNPVPVGIDLSMCIFIESHPIASGKSKKPGRQ